MKLTEKPLIFIFCLFMFSINIQAQNKEIDSLKNELKIHKEKDTTRVNLLNEIAFLSYNKDFDIARAYLQESENITRIIDFKKGTARTLHLKGVIESAATNYETGLQYYTQAIALYKKNEFKIGIAECYKSIGRFYYKNGKQKKAIGHYKKSLDIYEKLNDIEKTLTLLNNIGWSYILIGDYEIALTFYKKALKINEKTANDTLLDYCLSDMGVIYTHKGNYPTALEYFNKALVVGKKKNDTESLGNTLGNMGPIYTEIQKYDKAIDCYEKSIEIFKNTNKEAVASNLNNIGLVYKRKKDLQKAHKFLKEALEAYREINNKPGESFSTNNIGDIYLMQKKYDKAKIYFKRAEKINLEIESQLGLSHSYLGLATINVKQKEYDKALHYALQSQEISNKHNLLDYQRDVSKLLVEIYKSKNQYKKALLNHEQFKILNDSFFNKDNIQKITQLEYEYKYKQELDSASIRELKLTKTVKTVNQDLEKSQRNLFLGIIAFLVLGLILVAIIFYLKLRHEKSKTQNIAIEQKLLRSQMTPHFIFNSLSVLQGMILNKEDQKSVFYLSKFSKLLRLTLENSRDKMVPLHYELEAASNYLELQNLEEEKEVYKYTILVEDTIDRKLFKIPPMLIQPFIENAIEHAFPHQKENKKIDIQLKHSNEKLICTITDNGIGIDTQKKENNKNKKSLATTITSERLKALSKDFKVRGSVTIEDRKKHNQQGTLVTLVIPYKCITINNTY